MPTFLLLLVTIVWGSTFVIIKDTVRTVDPFLLVFVRTGIAALFMMVFLMIKHQGMGDKKSWARGLILGLLMAVIYGAQTIGLQYTSSGHSAFITGAAVVVVPLLLTLFFQTRIPVSDWIGIAVVFAGLFMLTYDFETKINPGDAITLITTLAFAVHTIYSGRFVRQSSALPLITAQFTGAALTSLIVFFITRGSIGHFSQSAVLSLVYLGVIGTLFCYFVSVWVQKVVSSIKVALLFSLEPLFAVLFAYLLAHETLTARELVGGAVMLGGIMIYQITQERLKAGLNRV